MNGDLHIYKMVNLPFGNFKRNKLIDLHLLTLYKFETETKRGH